MGLSSRKQAAATQGYAAQSEYISTADRGTGQSSFHGRQRELGSFGNLCNEARYRDTGTIFLVQGARGSRQDRTAIRVCARRAKELGWRVAEIQGSALYDPERLAKFLGMRYATRTTETLRKGRGCGAAVRVSGGLLAGPKKRRPTTVDLP